MIVKKEKRVRHENSPTCIAYEYSMDDKDINIALAEIDGRYPEVGLVTNEACKELIFVTDGSGRIVLEGKEYELNEGDTMLLPPKQKYFFEGKFKILMACTPAWYPEQHKFVGE